MVLYRELVPLTTDTQPGRAMVPSPALSVRNVISITWSG